MDNFEQQIEEIRRNCSSIENSLQKIKKASEDKILAAERKAGRTMVDIVEDWAATD